MNNRTSTSGKIRVAVLYGGRSGEHEISLRSAASVIRNLDPERFEIIPIGIDRDGGWHLNDLAMLGGDAVRELPVFADSPSVVLPPRASGDGAMLVAVGEPDAGREIDVVFPVMHGPLCEDGSIQGLCELAGVPYVGPGVLASAVGMDKDVAKRLVAAAGLPIVPYLALRRDRWRRERDADAGAALAAWAGENLGWPLFIKPANMGSSVGIHKVRSADDLGAALEDAFGYDLKVLIERSVDAREIELAVLENGDDPGEPLVSVAGEIAPSHEFYSYEAKYLDENGAALLIPAELTGEQALRARALAREIFLCLECEGMARVDLFLDRLTGEFYFNEVNTIPGFTTISMYPKLWEASGLSYRELLSTLVDLAIARGERRGGLRRERG
jgi:D-alanine-D-alanine ligase